MRITEPYPVEGSPGAVWWLESGSPTMRTQMVVEANGQRSRGNAYDPPQGFHERAKHLLAGMKKPPPAEASGGEEA